MATPRALVQRSGPPILLTLGDEELADHRALCLLCRAPATSHTPFDLAEGADLDERFEQLGELPLCGPCAQRKAQADRHGRPLLFLACCAPLLLVLLGSFTLPLTQAWMAFATFALGALAGALLIRAVRRARADRAVVLVLGGREDRIELRIRPPLDEQSAPRGPYRGAGGGVRGEATTRVVRPSDTLMMGLLFALTCNGVVATRLYTQTYPVVVIDGGGMQAQVTLDGRPLPQVPGGDPSVLRLRAGEHRISVTSAKGVEEVTRVEVGYGVSSLFSAQKGACYRRFGHYAHGSTGWEPSETDARWFTISDETEVLRIPCIDMAPPHARDGWP